MAGKRGKKQPQTFEFQFNDKKYIIRQPYRCQPTTLVLSDGKILKVTAWRLGVPFEPIADHTATFDPQQQEAAQLARARGGFVAQLVTTGDNGNATKEECAE